MSWIKRNLYFVIGTLVAVVLTGLAVFYLFQNLAANTDIAVAFQRELLGSPLTGTDKDCCQFEGEIGTDEQGTFTFGVTWKLKQPLKL